MRRSLGCDFFLRPIDCRVGNSMGRAFKIGKIAFIATDSPCDHHAMVMDFHQSQCLIVRREYTDERLGSLKHALIFDITGIIGLRFPDIGTLNDRALD